MSHVNKKTLDRQMYETLQSKQGFGRSKQQDKTLGLTDQYIYSFSTMKTYIRHGAYFCSWAKDNPQIREDLGRKPRTLAEVRPYAEAWIRAQEARGLSAYTVKMERSALEKIYGERMDFPVKAASRDGITRSRHEVAMDKHFSKKKNAAMINACRHVGFRRAELVKCKASDLVQKNGQYYVCITGKGGRYREAPVLNNDPATLDYIRGLKGHNHVHKAADIHSYRADYATAMYNSLRQPTEALRGCKIDYTDLTGKRAKDGSRVEKSALYYCRGSHKGKAMDRAAMIRVSQALGHNRESVVGEHYIR